MIDNKYRILWKLGAGGSSDVFLVNDENDTKYAVKILRNPTNNPDVLVLSTWQKEYFIMEMLSLHPNILKCIESVCDGELEHNGHKFTISYNITEYASNGALSSYIRRTGCFDEAVGRFYIRQLASAVAFMHEWKVAHMDIKPQNIVFDANFNFKVMDFGTADFNPASTGKSRGRRGTHGFMAPEVADLSVKTEFDVYKADVYSLGVTMHLMLFGRYPDAEDCEASSTEDSNSSGRHTSRLWLQQDELCCQDSCGATDLIRVMLSANPDDRPSMREVMSHRWLSDQSVDMSEDEVYREMSLRKEVVFPQWTKFNFE